MDNKVIIDESEVEGLKLTPLTNIRMKCQNCGCEVIKTYKHYRKNKLCRKCSLSKNKLKYQEKPLVVNVEDDLRFLEKYNQFQKITFVCRICKKTHTIEKRSFDYSFMCRNCKHNKTYESFSEERINEINKKREQTNLEKYGMAYFVNTEKCKETCLKKYGVANVFQNKDVIKRSKQTKIEKYGNENYVNPDKTRETMNLRYGGHTWSSEVLREKCDNTMRERYGKNLELLVKRSKHTKKERYNNENYNNTEKHKDTCIKRYGTDSFVKTNKFARNRVKRYVYEGMSFDSSWELYLWIYAKENNIDISKCEISFKYWYNDTEHLYFPDFVYNGKIVEVKGTHFFNENQMINPYDNVMNDLYEAKHQCMIDNGVEILSDISFAKNYVDNKYTKNYVKLFDTQIPFPYLNVNLNEKSDMGLIHHFHKSIYEGRVGNHPSPKEAWNDKSIVKMVALNRLKYIGKCRPSDILQGFNVTKKAPKVSVFKPSLAEELIKKYVDEGVIFDPFSGFSGRMLGAFKNNKKYIGQDLNEIHINESKEIAQYIQYECILLVQDIFLDEKKELEDTCLFTCPPYELKEQWNEGKDVKLTCDEWIDICLEKYQCGHYIFIVDSTKKYKNNIIDEIVNQSHFNKNKELVVEFRK